MVGPTNFLVGCDDGRGSSGEQQGDVRVATAAVVGGEPTDPCDWPSTVDINGCTGTLINPRVVTTAAHCLSWSNQVTFTAGKGMSGSFSVAGDCQGGAFGSSGGGSSRDWAYCILPDDERIKKFPITPPLVGCEAEKFLKAGGSAWVVGFGTTGSNQNDNGIKRAVEVKINAVENGIVDVGDKDVGACHGDSGGPLYVKIGDATHDWGWRVAGSTSSAGSNNCDCTCNTIYVDIKNHVQAVEQDQKIDVTPCTDADGKWDPTPECSDFISDPQKGTGTYPNCSVPMTAGPIETCGPGVMPMGGSGGAGSAGAGAGTGGSGTGGSGGNSGSGGNGTGGNDAAGSGGQSAIGTGGATSMGTGGAGVIGTGGTMAGAGGAPVQPVAGSGALPAGTGGLSGIAGQPYVPNGTGGVPVVPVVPPAEEITKSHSDTGCRVGSDARGGASALLPVFALLAWQRARRRRPCQCPMGRRLAEPLVSRASARTGALRSSCRDLRC